MQAARAREPWSQNGVRASRSVGLSGIQLQAGDERTSPHNPTQAESQQAAERTVEV